MNAPLTANRVAAAPSAVESNRSRSSGSMIRVASDEIQAEQQPLPAGSPRPRMSTELLAQCRALFKRLQAHPDVQEFASFRPRIVRSLSGEPNPLQPFVSMHTIQSKLEYGSYESPQQFVGELHSFWSLVLHSKHSESPQDNLSLCNKALKARSVTEELIREMLLQIERDERRKADQVSDSLRAHEAAAAQTAFTSAVVSLVPPLPPPSAEAKAALDEARAKEEAASIAEAQKRESAWLAAHHPPVMSPGVPLTTLSPPSAIISELPALSSHATVATTTMMDERKEDEVEQKEAAPLQISGEAMAAQLPAPAAVTVGEPMVLDDAPVSSATRSLAGPPVVPALAAPAMAVAPKSTKKKQKKSPPAPKKRITISVAPKTTSAATAAPSSALAEPLIQQAGAFADEELKTDRPLGVYIKTEDQATSSEGALGQEPALASPLVKGASHSSLHKKRATKRKNHDGDWLPSDEPSGQLFTIA
jgi:hypothetical protein